jgi:hypothetical protein
MDHAELFKEIRKIEIVTRALVNDRLAGQYQSVFKGRGMSFDQVRQYEIGDDVRLIDWNVSARMNAPYIKMFVEEREMTSSTRRPRSSSAPRARRRRSSRPSSPPPSRSRPSRTTTASGS